MRCNVRGTSNEYPAPAVDPAARIIRKRCSMKYVPVLLVLLMLGSGAAMAAMQHGGTHEARQGGVATQEYMKAMDAMHDPMMLGVMAPDPDTAFVRGMLWHHRGAVDMAKIQLKYGKDPDLNKLAEAIIKAQGPEIEYMETWLKKRNLQE